MSNNKNNYEKIRSQIAKKYKEELEEKNRLIKELTEDNQKLILENDQLRQDNITKDDWILRMLDYCNMNEDDLKKAIENEKNRNALFEKFNNATIFAAGNSPLISTMRSFYSSQM